MWNNIKHLFQYQPLDDIQGMMESNSGRSTQSLNIKHGTQQKIIGYSRLKKLVSRSKRKIIEWA